MCHGWLLLVSYRSGGGGFAGGGVGLGLLGRGLLRPLLFADRNDLQDRVLLAMPVAAAIVVTAVFLDADDLHDLMLLDNLGRHGQTVGGLTLATLPGKTPFSHRYSFACFAGHIFTQDFFSRGDLLI